jgi:hypothetical protein
MQFGTYDTEGFHDEMFDANGEARAEARLLLETIESLPEGQLQQCQAERLLVQLGITFNVYGDSMGAERVFPFDLIPRIVPAAEWAWIERGLKTANSRAERGHRRRLPSEGHITLAWGRDYADVTPVKGIALGGGAQKVEVEVRVEPVSSPTSSPAPRGHR